MSKIETEEEIDTMKKIIATLRNNTPSESTWLNKKEVPEPFKLEGSELTEMTQKKAYKMILRHHNRQPGNDQTKKRIEETKKELLQKTGVCMTINCKEAKLQAGIKPTALCSAIDKENSIESLLDFATLYIQLLS